MKEIIKLVTGMLLFLFLLSSCGKDGVKPGDFRNKYIGKYQTKETIFCYGPCASCSSQRDTVISVNYGLTDSTLNVLGRDVFLDSTGFYYAYHYGLHLRNDSLFSTYMNGGLGCGQYETYIGAKVSNKP